MRPFLILLWSAALMGWSLPTRSSSRIASGRDRLYRHSSGYNVRCQYSLSRIPRMHFHFLVGSRIPASRMHSIPYADYVQCPVGKTMVAEKSLPIQLSCI